MNCVSVRHSTLSTGVCRSCFAYRSRRARRGSSRSDVTCTLFWRHWSQFWRIRSAKDVTCTTWLSRLGSVINARYGVRKSCNARCVCHFSVTDEQKIKKALKVVLVVSFMSGRVIIVCCFCFGFPWIVVGWWSFVPSARGTRQAMRV